MKFLDCKDIFNIEYAYNMAKHFNPLAPEFTFTLLFRYNKLFKTGYYSLPTHELGNLFIGIFT